MFKIVAFCPPAWMLKILLHIGSYMQNLDYFKYL